jgi:hypothetical protein
MRLAKCEFYRYRRGYPTELGSTRTCVSRAASRRFNLRRYRGTCPERVAQQLATRLRFPSPTEPGGAVCAPRRRARALETGIEEQNAGNEVRAQRQRDNINFGTCDLCA